MKITLFHELRHVPAFCLFSCSTAERLSLIPFRQKKGKEKRVEDARIGRKTRVWNEANENS